MISGIAHDGDFVNALLGTGRSPEAFSAALPSENLHGKNYNRGLGADQVILVPNVTAKADLRALLEEEEVFTHPW